MKALLLYPTSEFVGKRSYENRQDIVKDLNLDVIFRAASRELSSLQDSKVIGKEDPYIIDIMRKIMLIPLSSEEELVYRQQIIKDVMDSPELIVKLYRIAKDACEDIKKFKENAKEQKNKHLDNIGTALSSYEILQQIIHHMGILDELLTQTESVPTSLGLKTFYERYFTEFSKEYMELLLDTMHDLEVFLNGGAVKYSAQLGPGMKQMQIKLHSLIPSGYQKRKRTEEPSGTTTIKWYQKLFQSNTIVMKEEVLLREAHSVENAIFTYLMEFFEEFIKEMVEFFEQLHIATAFYVGCYQLKERMCRFHLPYCMPKVVASKTKEFQFGGLYELSMALLMQKLPTRNDLISKDQWLYIITGANQGGKSTYLRSIGIAQVMMQCGMFVAASGYESNLYDNLFMHFTRREDSAMNSGRLDEEMKRMDGIVRAVTKDSMVLLNESFATTTEKEGSMIAMDLVKAFYEAGIKICMVTHLLQFANDMYLLHPAHAMFLSAERKENGERTFKILEHAPSATSFGLDLYDEIILNQRRTN